MRFIKKSETFFEFHLDQAAKKPAPTNAAETERRWRNLDKEVLRQRLFEEQYGLCAYSELNIEDFKEEHNSRHGAHIEHIKPKSEFNHLCFVYLNLVLSAMDDGDLTLFNKQQRFGGHHKLREYDETFISPLLVDVSDFFVFSSENGEVSPRPKMSEVDKNRAEETIRVLNLNAPYLKNLRKNWLQELQTEIDKLIDVDSLEGIEHMAECELLPYQRYCSGNDTQVVQLRPFHTASLQLFGSVGMRVLTEHYPQGL